MTNDTERLLQDLRDLLLQFEQINISPDIRTRVQGLLPAYRTIKELGKSLVPEGLTLSARERLLAYFRRYPKTVLKEKELELVAGIGEWARRIRELRIEFGWKIITGLTVKQMQGEAEFSEGDIDLATLDSKDYVLLDSKQDRDAAYRWNIANKIRRSSGSGREKILNYLRENVGKTVTGDEFSYVANSSEWARRTRELRTEYGWPITTKMSGNPHLPVGVYVLEMDRQAPAHDRKIPEGVRRRALRRDKYICQNCGWSHEMWNRSDPRFLELHHKIRHSKGGTNKLDNLITYCNIL